MIISDTLIKEYILEYNQYKEVIHGSYRLVFNPKINKYMVMSPVRVLETFNDLIKGIQYLVRL